MTVRLTKYDSAWTGDNPRQVFQYEVRGYPFGEGAGIWQPPHQNWSVLRWNKTEQTEWMGDFPTADAALAELQERFENGDSRLVSRKKIEGSLEIMWANFTEPAAPPLFAVRFLPVAGFEDGPQRSKEINGKEALKRYLQQLDFPLLRIYGILQEIETAYCVDLPKVMMNEYEYAVTYRT